MATGNKVNYHYECKKCGKEHEAVRLVEERNTTACPHCGAKPERQIILIGGVKLPTTIKKMDTLTTEADIIAERGPDWRETARSRAMADGIPERTYHGNTMSGIRRR